MTSTNTNTDEIKTNTICRNTGCIIENSYKLECEKQEAQQILNDTQCEQCKEYGHTKANCPKTPDSPTTTTRKYNLYIHGGIYQGKRYYEDDFEGGVNYLQDQMDKKYALMTPEELKAKQEEIEYLDDDYMWNRC